MHLPPIPAPTPRSRLLLLMVTFACAMPMAWPLDDGELQLVRDGFEGRRDSYLSAYLDNPLHEIDEGFKKCRTGLGDANWLWYPGENGAALGEIGTRYFRCTFTIPPGHRIGRAYAAFAVDNYGSLSVNGNSGSYLGGFRQAAPLEITGQLQHGENVVTITAHNAGADRNPAGIIGVLYVEFDGEPPLTILTDGTWRSTKADPATTTDDSWRTAEILGTADSPPWGVPQLGLEGEVNHYVFTRLCFALAALHLDTRVPEANVAILEAVNQIRSEYPSLSESNMHWLGGSLDRLYGLFGPGGVLDEGMTPEAADAIWHLFADWAQSESLLAESDPEHTWRLWGSENHSAQRDATRWAAARMIATHPRGETFRYDDGSTAAEQLAGWQSFMKRYFRERISRGMLIEISPSGYGSRTMQGWHNIYDFTDDPELKFLTKSALDLWWADWAQEQLNGMRGGGKTRLYPGAYALSHSDRNRAMSWFYIGGEKPAHQHETLPVIATTTYRLPLVVMDIALDTEGRGVYETHARRLGRMAMNSSPDTVDEHGHPIYEVDPEYGALIRYTYCAPEFIIGSLMMENQPNDYWSRISAQNRWHGVIFSGDLDSTIYPRCDTNRSTSNAHWAVQNKGTLIAQKLRDAVTTKGMRVCFSTDLKRYEKSGWIFAEAEGAYAAVKIVQGDWTWVDDRWLRCEEEYTPVILEVVRKLDYNHDPNAFESAVLQQSVQLEDGVLRYRGLREDAGHFTFYTEDSRLPKVNGEPIDLRPEYAFKSPFVNEAWASGVVRITKDERELLIDVRPKGTN